MRKAIWARHLAVVLVVAGTLYGAQNCGQTAGSSLASLDNFAAGKNLRRNQCFVNPGVAQPSHPFFSQVYFLDKGADYTSDLLRKEVVAALGTIPRGLLDALYAQNGKVVVTHEADTICRASPGASSSPEVGGCLVFFTADATHRQILNIILPDDVNAIHHGTTRIVASALTQLFSRAQRQSDGTYLMTSEERPALRKIKDRLTTAFLQDVVASPLLDEKVLAGYLGDGALKDIKKNKAKGQDPLAGIEVDQDRQDAFEDFVFAETFDSYFCNTWGPFDQGLAEQIAAGSVPATRIKDLIDTRKSLATFFPKTSAYFTDAFPKYLTAADIPGGAKAKSAGLALTDESGDDVAAEAVPWTIARSNGGGFGLLGDGGLSFGQGARIFFGSIYDDTIGRAASAHQTYSNAVGRAVDATYNPNANVVTNIGNAVGGGVATTYREQVAEPVGNLAEARYNAIRAGGGGNGAAAFGALYGTLSDATGVTKIAEAYEGTEFSNPTGLGSNLESLDRIQRGIAGTGALAGNAALVAGFVPRNIGPISLPTGSFTDVVSGADLATARQISINANQGIVQRLVSEGTTLAKAEDVAASFNPGAEIGPSRGGNVVRYFDSGVRAGEGSGPLSRYVGESKIANPIQDLALPQNFNDAGRLATYQIKEGTMVINGTAAPNFGQLGGGQQTYVLGDLNSVLGPARVPFSPGTSFTAIATGQIANNANTGTSTTGSNPTTVAPTGNTDSPQEQPQEEPVFNGGGSGGSFGPETDG